MIVWEDVATEGTAFALRAIEAIFADPCKSTDLLCSPNFGMHANGYL
ncbi:MAG TPA: hypothetical protein PLK42_10090 [Casimicrobium sp.]|nr:hypothetical protein [Casimicrobium sp.]HPT57016.1 hypothetical protein [Casimicrobium sp.]